MSPFHIKLNFKYTFGPFKITLNFFKHIAGPHLAPIFATILHPPVVLLLFCLKFSVRSLPGTPSDAIFSATPG